MDKLKIRETRFGFVLKIFSPLLIALGGLIVFFGQNETNKLESGNIALLGAATLIVTLLFTMVCYIFKELRCFQVDESECTKIMGESADKAYNDIFSCFIKSGSALLLYVFTFCAMLMFYSQGVAYVEPSPSYVAILFIAGLFLVALPRDFCLTVLGNKVNTKCHSTDENEQTDDRGFRISIILNKIKQLQWTIWSILVFDLLYLVWFK